MKIVTDRGDTFDAAWAFAPAGLTADLVFQISDGRPLSELAAIFEGCETLHRISEAEGDMDFEGYTVLKGIARINRGGEDVRVTLARPEGGAW